MYREFKICSIDLEDSLGLWLDLLACPPNYPHNIQPRHMANTNKIFSTILLWVFVSWHWKDVMRMLIQSLQSHLAPCCLNTTPWLICTQVSHISMLIHVSKPSCISSWSETLSLLVHLENFSPSNLVKTASVWRFSWPTLFSPYTHISVSV